MIELVRKASMDVSEWLRGLGLDQYAPAFRENKITPDLLPSLTAEDLRELGVGLVGDRRRLLTRLRLWPRHQQPNRSPRSPLPGRKPSGGR